MKETNKITRNSNIELLRIVLILMVISLHYLNGADWGGGLLSHVTQGSLNYYIANFLESAFIMAVDTFIIITGYFSLNKTSIRIAKPIKLYSLLIFYGLIFSAFMLCFKNPVMNFETLKFVAKTICYRWFLVIYCVLYILIPFLNKFIHSLTQKQFFTLLVINAIFFYVINTFSPWLTVNDYGYGIVNFINLYLVGAYLKLYHPDPLPKKIGSLIFLGCVLFTTVFSIIPLAFASSRAWSYISIFNLISAIALFEFFRAMDIKYNSVINYFASYTFAVYIINGCGPVPPFVYRKIFKSDLYWNHPHMIFNFIICVLGFYCICVVIEFMRRCLFSKYGINKSRKFRIKLIVNKLSLVKRGLIFQMFVQVRPNLKNIMLFTI